MGVFVFEDQVMTSKAGFTTLNDLKGFLSSARPLQHIPHSGTVVSIVTIALMTSHSKARKARIGTTKTSHVAECGADEGRRTSRCGETRDFEFPGVARRSTSPHVRYTRKPIDHCTDNCLRGSRASQDSAIVNLLQSGIHQPPPEDHNIVLNKTSTCIQEK